MCTLADDPAQSSAVLDRELDEEKSREPSDPRIRCPLCGWSPRKEDLWFCTCGLEWNTFDTWRRVPRLPTSVDFNPMPKPNAYRAAAGRRTRIGMRSDSMMAAWHSSVRFQAGSLW